MFCLASAKWLASLRIFRFLMGLRVDDQRVVSGIVYVIQMVCSRRMHLRSMGHIRRSITASFAGAGSACSTGFSLWPANGPIVSGAPRGGLN